MLVRNKSKSSKDNTDNELLRVAIDGRGLGSIARAAAKKLYAPVFVYDYLDGIVAQSSSKSAGGATSQDNTASAINKENIIEIVDKLATTPETDGFNGAVHDVRHVTLGEHDVYAAHVMIGWEKVAMVLTTTPFDLDKISLDVLRKTAEAVAIEISRTRAIEEAEARAYGDFLSDVIAGRIPLSQVETRLSKLGVDLSGGFTIVECDFEEGNISGRFYRETLRLIKGESKNSLIIEHEGSLVILLAFSDDETKPDQVSHSQRLSKKVLDIAGSLQINMNIGISRLKVNAGDILKALDEAKVALDFGRRMEGIGSVTKFDEVGIYRLLLPIARESSEEGRQFYSETIGCLVDYDKKHGTNLVETLECFRRNNENIALTAEELFAHRHTIRYRLQRVSEITGSDPFTGTERDRLYMGLYVKHLLNL
jgi:sugar diacid utilization regulator